MIKRQRREREKKRTETLKTLWTSLCSAHNLKRAEKKLLKQAAGDLNYSDPSMIFFLPGSFSSLLEERRRHYSSSDRKILRDLRRTLFPEQQHDTQGENGSAGDDGLPHRFAPDELEKIQTSGVRLD